ncbi:MAG: diguanylate cyclase [Lachnospiraceae bacterium]|nr:diguanylate cyclase [Lachnospiraceae bacterium]
MKRYGVAFACIICFIFLLFCPPLLLLAAEDDTADAADAGSSSSQEEEPPLYRILCISSYSLSHATVPEMLSGIEEGLSGVPYEIDYEFMDSQNFYKREDVTSFYHYVAYKMKHHVAYDLVITCDDSALRFWKNNRNELFAKLPMIFVGVNSASDAATSAKLPSVTGVAEVPDYIGTLDLMHELFPDRTMVYAIVDGSVSGRGEYAQFREILKEYDELPCQLLLTDDYSTEGLKKALAHIPSDAMILYLDFMQDADGTTYSDVEASELLYENAIGIPIFRTTSPNIGYGVLGGKMYSYSAAGKTAGEMAADVLSGKKEISDIPLVADAVTEYIFDQVIMDEYGISEFDLPPNTTIVNPHRNPITFYKENPVQSNLILIIIAILFAITGILIVSNRQREMLVNTDFLTQIPNRHYIQARTSAVIARKQPFAILMMDIDHFKSINDTLGHATGDELLAGVASRLKGLSTRGVLFARIGGDEFMALITGRAMSTADQLCANVVKQVTQAYHLSTGELHVTTSVGLAAYPEHCSDPNSLNAYADSALYYVKEHGRNGYQIYSNQCSFIEPE